MKTLMASIVLAPLQASCRPADRSPTSHVATDIERAAAISDVTEAVERFRRMWEDVVTFDEIIAHDADLVVLSTDAAERNIGFDAYHDARVRQFDSFENVEYEGRDLTVKISGDARATWFAEEFNLFLLANGAHQTRGPSTVRRA